MEPTGVNTQTTAINGYTEKNENIAQKILHVNPILDQGYEVRDIKLKNSFFPFSIINISRRDPDLVIKNLYRHYPLKQRLGIDTMSVENLELSFRNRKILANFFTEIKKQIFIHKPEDENGVDVCYYILQQWTNEKLWDGKFDAVYLISSSKAKTLTEKDNDIVSTLIRSTLNLNEEYQIDSIRKHLTQVKREKTLLVIDGCGVDFTQGQLPKFIRELTNYPNWILLKDSKTTLQIDVDSHYETDGVEIKSIPEAIISLCPNRSKEELDTLNQRIHQNPLLQTIASRPSILKAICMAFDSGYLGIDEKLTLTDVYRAFADFYASISSCPSQDRLQCAKMLDAAAWQSLETKQSPLQIELPNQYYLSFLHTFHFGLPLFNLLFRDFLAARHLSTILKTDPKLAETMISEKVFCSSYQSVFRFVAGLLKRDSNALNDFFEILNQKKDALNFYLVLLKIECFEEAGWPERAFDNDRTEIESWCTQILNPGSWQLIKDRMLDTFINNPKTAENVFFPLLCEAMTHRDKKVRAEALEALSALQFDDPFVSSMIKQALAYPGDMRQAVIKGLCRAKLNIARHWEATHLIGAVFSDVDPTIVLGGIEYLDKAGIFHPKIAMVWLTKGLVHRSNLIKGVSANALRKLINKIPKEAFQFLKKSFYPHETHTNSIFIDLLAQVSPDEDIIWLMDLIKEELFLHTTQEWYVNSLMLVLEKIGRRAPKTVIPYLLSLLTEENFSHKEDLIPVIGKIGKVAPKETLLLFEEELSKQSDIEAGDSEGAACVSRIPQLGNYLIEALGYFEGHASDEVIAFFSRIFQQDNDRSKIAVLKALAKMGSNSQEALSFLLCQALGNSEAVNIEHIKALGKVGRENPLRIFPNLLLKMNKSAQLDIHIVHVFGKLGSYTTSKTIDTLAKNQLTHPEKLTVKSLLDWSKVPGKHLTQVFTTLSDRLDFACDDEKCSILDALQGSVNEKIVSRIDAIVDGPYILKVKKSAVQLIISIARTDLKDISKSLFKVMGHYDPEIVLEALNHFQGLNHLEKIDLMQLLKPIFASDSIDVIRKTIVLLVHLRLVDQEQSLLFLQKWIKRDEVKGLVYFAFNQLDLSLHPKLLMELLEDYYFFQKQTLPLSSTPLSALVKEFIKLKRGQAKQVFLLAVIIKSLSENHAIFFEKNQLCLFEEAKIHRIEVNEQICKKELKEALYLHKENHFVNRAKKLRSKKEHSLAGYYFKQAVRIDDMLASYEEGVKNNDAEALYVSGLFSHVGIGSLRSLKENYKSLKDLSRSLGYYERASGQEHVASIRMLGTCYHYGLGMSSPNLEIAAKYHNKAYSKDRTPIDFPKELPQHCFIRMSIPFLVDTSNNLLAAETIALALGTLELHWIKREAILSCLEKKKRPDIEFDTPCVTVDSNGDLLIDLSKELIKRKSLLSHLSKMGCLATSINIKRSAKRYRVRYVVPRCEIRDFLLNKLWLHSAVYENLRNYYPQIERS